MTRRIPDDAFEYYVGLGPGRSHRAVADHFGVSKRAVTKRAASEDWTKRLDAIERESRERMDKKLTEAMEESRERHMKMLKAMSGRAIAALKQYPITSGMDAMRAAELVIKLERLVAGEASERTALSVEETTRRQLIEWGVVREVEDDSETP